jgi:two-component system chemotaxis response regulator CheB
VTDKKKLRVLVVDDSAHNRRAIAAILGNHPDIEIVGTADDGEKALKSVAALKPDLITLDLEMPRMDGFTFLRILMQQMPTPVIVISSLSRKQQVFQVLELGALDFVGKPTRFFSAEEPGLRDELINKVLAVRFLQIVPFNRRAAGKELTAVGTALPPKNKPAVERVERVVCIGASTGGPPALQAIFKALNQGSGTAYMVAQHMPEKFTRAFAERLNRTSSLQICEAQDGMAVVSGGAYIAPGGAQLQLASIKGVLSCAVVAAVSSDRYSPSIDMLFETAAPLFKTKLLAVVLTGMGSDGSAGVRLVHKFGGQVIAESSESAIVYGMPKEAMQTGCVDESLPLDGIIEYIHNFSKGL